MKLRITEVDYAPEELYKQTPFEINLLRQIPGSDRPDYWIGELTNEIKWINNNFEIEVSYVIVSARWVGTSIQPGVSNLPIGLAYVVDMSILKDENLDFEKCKYVAIGIAHEIGEVQEVKKRNGILSGVIGKIFGTGK